MADDIKITYKNHCTPQEYVTDNSRWYLDSDVGFKLTGTVVHEPSSRVDGISTPTTLLANETVVDLGTTKDFLYIKNLGLTSAGVVSAADVDISFADADTGAGAAGYCINLAPGECFASEMSTFANLYVKSDGVAETTIEYITAT